ncbi:MAG: hypothetical protein CVU11_08105 [Bacteroidetes bacterium HGW-Bacteroidetes-6]|jgi:hypothetical protein|nr:MAG: hypothetical protein CVU11_08105 [Bacteroidetes bacterium HGW-Bacteroidetes-6]
MKLLVLFVFCAFAYTNMGAQCCSAGNPVAGTGFESSLSKGLLQVSTSAKYSISDQFYLHDNKVDNPYIQKSSFLYQNLWLSYSFTNRFSISAESGYFYDKSQLLLINNSPFKLGANGIGDLLVNAKFVVLKKMKPVTQLAFSAGTKIPVGAFHQSVNGVTIPVSLQPSAGAFRWTAAAYFQRLSANQQWGFASQASVELSSEINKNYLVYRYGPFYRINAGVMRKVFPKVNVSLFGVFDFRGKDTREYEEVVESSGSYSVFIQPWIQYAFRPNRILFANFDFPVYRYFLGEQIGNKCAFQMGFRFQYSKKECQSDSNL